MVAGLQLNIFKVGMYQGVLMTEKVEGVRGVHKASQEHACTLIMEVIKHMLNFITWAT